MSTIQSKTKKKTITKTKKCCSCRFISIKRIFLFGLAIAILCFALSIVFITTPALKLSSSLHHNNKHHEHLQNFKKQSSSRSKNNNMNRNSNKKSKQQQQSLNDNDNDKINNNNNDKKQNAVSTTTITTTNTSTINTIVSDYHIVFSTGCNNNQDWQSYIMFYHILKSKQKGFVTRIVSGCNSKRQKELLLKFNKEIKIMSPKRFYIHFTPDYSTINSNKKLYKYYNKPYGIKHWLQYKLGYYNTKNTKNKNNNGNNNNNNNIHDNTIIIILDPDQIILRPFTNDFTTSKEKYRVSDKSKRKTKVEHGSPFAQQYGFVLQWYNKVNMSLVLSNLYDDIYTNNNNNDDNNNNEELKLLSSSSPIITNTIQNKDKYIKEELNNYYWAMGPPYIATAKDMSNIIKYWCLFVPKIYNQYPHLLAEMFGYNLASAHLQLRHTIVHSFQISDYIGSIQLEGWSLLNDMLTNNNDTVLSSTICNKENKEETNNNNVDYYPHVLHYCQMYSLNGWSISKYKLHKDFLSCESPLLKVPSDNNNNLFQSKVLPDSYTKTQVPKHNKFLTKYSAFTICTLINAFNDAAIYYKNHNCKHTKANYNYTYKIEKYYNQHSPKVLTMTKKSSKKQTTNASDITIIQKQKQQQQQEEEEKEKAVVERQTKEYDNKTNHKDYLIEEEIEFDDEIIEVLNIPSNILYRNVNEPKLITTVRKYHIVFSTGCSVFQDWQSYTFFYHIIQSKQEGDVTRIVSGCNPKQTNELIKIFNNEIKPMENYNNRFHIHFTPNYSKIKPSIKRPYKYYNKPYGMKHWLEEYLGFKNNSTTNIHDDTIIILLDPDQIILRPFTNDFTKSKEKWKKSYKLKVEHGSPFAQQYGYGLQWLRKVNITHILYQNKIKNSPLLTLSDSDANDYYFSMGAPYIATAKDMYNIVTYWCLFVPYIFDSYPHLLAEMFGYNLASAHLQLRHTISHSFQISDVSAQFFEGWYLFDQLQLPHQQEQQQLQDSITTTGQNPIINEITNYNNHTIGISNALCSSNYHNNNNNFFQLQKETLFPHVFHYCQSYKIGKWFLSKYKLRKDFLSCNTPLLQIPTPKDNLTSYTYSIDINGQRKDYKTKQSRMLIYSTCILYNAFNDVAIYYKDHHCNNTNTTATTATNYNYTYIINPLLQKEFDDEERNKTTTKQELT